MALIPFDGELDAPVPGLVPFTGKLDGEPEGIVDTVKKGLAGAKNYDQAIASGINEGIANTIAGAGTFIQAPAANTLSGLASAAALVDRGITSAANFVSPGSAALNDGIQDTARSASRFAAEERAKNADSNIVANAGLKMQDFGREHAKYAQEQNKQFNPELIRQQQNMAGTEGFIGALEGIKDNPMAFTQTLARSAPDMMIGAGVAKGVASGIAAAGGSAARQVAGASTAGILSEAGSSAYQGREGVYQQVAGMPIDRLAASPRFNEILAQTGDAAKSREILANELADQVPLLSAAGTAMGSVITNKLFGGDTSARMIAGVQKTTGKDVLKNMGQESTEEAFQGVPEDLAQHGAVVQADPSAKFDLGKTIAENAAAGLAMGTGGSAISFARDNFGKQAGEIPPAPPPLPDTGPMSRSANLAISTGAAADAASVLGVPADDAMAETPLGGQSTKNGVDPLDRVNEIDRSLQTASPVPQAYQDQMARLTTLELEAERRALTPAELVEAEQLQSSLNQGESNAEQGLLEVQQQAEGATTQPVAGVAAGATQQEVASAPAIEELTPIERVMRSRNDRQLNNLTGAGHSNTTRQAASAEIARRLTTRAQPTTTSPLQQAATQLNMPNSATVFAQNGVDSVNSLENIKQLQEQLEQTDPFTEQSSALTEKLQSAVTQDAQSALNSGEMPVYKVTDHVSVAIHPSAQNPGMVQVTRYTKDGVIGDSQYNNVDDAVRQEGLTHKPRIPSGDAIKAIEQSIAAEAEYQQRKGNNAAQPAQMDTQASQANDVQARVEQGASQQAVARIDKQSVYSSPDDGESAPDDVKRNALGLPEGYTFATGKDSKEKVAASSLRVGDILSVDGRIVSVDNVVQKDDGTVDLLIGSTGGKSTYNVSPDRILERRKIVKSETTAAETKPKTLTVGAMPNTAPGKSGISKGAAGIAQRQANAANNFIESVQEQFGLSKEDAGKAWYHFVQNKLVKIDAVGGQYSLTDGRLWDGEVMRRAASGNQEPAKAKPNRRQIDATKDTLFQAIAKLGGMDTQELTSNGFDPKDITYETAAKVSKKTGKLGKKSRLPLSFGFNMPLHKKGGMSFDGVLEELKQHGYFPEDATKNDAIEAFRRELGGDAVMTPDAAMQQAEMQAEQEENDAIGYDDLSDREKALVDFHAENIYDEDSPIEAFKRGMKRDGATEDEINEAIKQTFGTQETGNNDSGGSAQGTGETRDAQGAWNGSQDGQVQESAEPDWLTGQTNEQAAAELAKRKADIAEEKRQHEELIAKAKRESNAKEKARRAAQVLAEREAAKKAEVDKAAEDFALGQAAPAPVDRKVTTEDARGQQDVFAQAKYAGPADVSSRAGQMELSNRAVTIAALKGMNEQLRKIAPDEAWADRNIEDAQNLDALRDQISQALVDANRGKPDVNPLRKELEELSGQELKDVFSKLNLAGKLMAYEERISALLMEDAAEVRAAISAVTGNPSESTAQPVKATTEAKAVEPAAQSAEQKIRAAFDALPSVSLGVAYPITVEHNGVKREFMVRQDALGRGKIPALHVVAIHQGRMIASDEKSWIAQSYKLNWKNELTEEGLPKKISDQEADEFKANFKDKPAAVDAKNSSESDNFGHPEQFKEGELAKKRGDARALPLALSIAKGASREMQDAWFSGFDKAAKKSPAVDAKKEAETKPEDQAAKQSQYNTMADVDSAITGIYDGTLSLDDYKAAFNGLMANKDAIAGELGKMTIPQLHERFGKQPYGRPEKKGEIVERAFESIRNTFSLRRSYGRNSWTMGPGQYEKYQADNLAALTELVNSSTAEELKSFADEIEKTHAARQEKIEAAKDPKTIEDFENALRLKKSEGMTFAEARMSLTPEQRAEYDRLRGTESRDQRKARADQQKTDVRVAAQTTDGQVVETKHTKTGEPLFVVKAAERVDRDVYSLWNATAKRMGGYYSSFRGNGAVPGFQFKTRENADAFLAFIGGKAEAAKEVVQERRDAFADDKSQSAVERLNEMADRMEERADESLGRERKANTERRARFAASAESAANAEKAMAKTMRRIADAISNGTAQFLDRVRQKAQIEYLSAVLRTAKSNEIRNKYPSYADQEKHRSDPETEETADYAEFPQYAMMRSDLANLARKLVTLPNMKMLGQRILKAADDTSEAYNKFAKENLLSVSRFGKADGSGFATFSTVKDAERSIEISNLGAVAVPLQIKRGEYRIVLSPSEAINRGIWQGDDRKITLAPDIGAEIVEKLGRLNRKYGGRRGMDAPPESPWQFENAYNDRKRLSGMGIEQPWEFRAALREFAGLKEAPKERDKIKEMERAMIGRKNDGLDFFPTPSDTARAMIDAAELTDGMAVLEPSAGMGHIAEQIREAGIDPDVIEFNSDRRELLEAKGFNVVGSDFMDMTPRGFTFGDVFRDKDGVEGIMRGSGGMGSGRVGFIPLGKDERQSEWRDRDELEGVRKNGINSGYDRIVMNPPFSNRRDAEHVQHAYTLLRPGGRLVAIMGEGVFFGQDKKAQQFRDWLEEVGGTSEKLDEGTFLDPSLPVNTATNARMVVIQKHETDKGVALYSKSQDATQSAPFQRQQAESRIKSILGDKLGKVLIDSGIVTFTNKGNEYQGATYKDGSIVLNLDALSADNFDGIFAHEGFHSAIRDLVGEQTYAQLMKRLDNMRALGNGGQWFKDAIASVPAGTRTEHVTEEIAAYAVQGYVNGAKQPNVITRWVESLLSALRTAIIRRLPSGKLKSWAVNNLQPQDLANLAIAGLKAKARGQLQAQGREAMAFSKINQTDTPAFKKWFGDSKVVDNSFASLLSEPDGIGILLNDLLSAQNASSSGLDPVQALMLALAKNDKIGRGIVGLVPVDVVNSFSKDGFRPKNGGGNTSMFVNALNAPVSDQVLSAFRGVLASLSTKLANAIATGRDQEVAPALFASDFNLREVGGLLSLQGGTDFWSGNTGVKSVGASETAKSASPGLGAPTKNLKLDAAALADLLNRFVSFAPHAKSSISDDLPSAKYIAKQGKPLVVYHGTNADFSEFKTTRGGEFGPAIYFTDSPREAGEYSEAVKGVSFSAPSAHIMPMFVRIENPYTKGVDEFWKEFGGVGSDADGVERAKAAGYDGVIAKRADRYYDNDAREFVDRGNMLTHYIAFDKSQAKSAIGNNGNFDGSNPDIRLSRATGSQTENQSTVAQRAEEIISKPVAAWRPIDTVARMLTTTVRLDRLTSAVYDRAAHLLDRYTPESVKAGVVSDYGVPESVLDQRTLMQGRMRVQLRKSGELIDKLATLTRAESRVAYEWMNNNDPQARAYFEAQLPEESVKVMEEVKDMIDKLSQEAVALGQLDPEAFKRNRFEYLRRSYIKHTTELTKSETAGRKRAIAILGDQYKGRGMTDAVDMAKFKNVAPEWWGRKLKDGQADKGLKGEKFIRLERRAPAGEGVGDLQPAQGPGETNPQKKGRLLEVAYWPAGEPLPAKYSTWDQSGTWEVRDTKGGKLIVWRDFTKAERVAMGEIDEARYAIAKSLHGMIHDVETGRYLEWLAQRYAKKPGEAIDGEIVDASERMRDTFAPGEWVQVPETKIPGTSVLKYGKLAGLYLPGPIWNDVRQTVGFRFKPLGETYAAILGAWKTAKTALSPAVHTNNVMANFVMADWHDVSASHILKALRIILGASQREGKGIIGRAGNAASRAGIVDSEAAREVINRFMDSGANLGSWVTAELQKDQLEPLLAALENEIGTVGESAGTMASVSTVLQLFRAKEFRQAAAQAAISAKNGAPGQFVVGEAKSLIDLYEAEDQVFRLAAWLKAKEDGAADSVAGKIARRSFLDYHINAPWIQAMRNSAFPFISFTYRAVPMLLETAARKPHKLMKLAMFAGLVNAIGYLLSGGDEDDERRLLPEEKAGRVWGLVPKLVRMPWNDKFGSPVFLDIRRFVPVSDIFDTGQNHAAIPMLPFAVPGGPLAIISEVVSNKSQFTGRPITLETDTGAEKAAKLADHLYKAFAPNIVILPGTHAFTGVVNAGSGRTDSFGREQSVVQAGLTSFGVKVGSYPKDVLMLNAMRQAEGQMMEIDRQITQEKRELQRRGVSEDEFMKNIDSLIVKKQGISERLQKRLGGG